MEQEQIQEEKIEQDQSVFLDKLKLTFALLEKESQLIAGYAVLVNKIRQKYLNLDKVIETDAFAECFRTSYEIYAFLEYNKIQKINDKNVDVEKLKSIMKKYVDNEELDLDDLNDAVRIIRQVMSKSGYHDDLKKSKEAELEDEGS